MFWTTASALQALDAGIPEAITDYNTVYAAALAPHGARNGASHAVALRALTNHLNKIEAQIEEARDLLALDLLFGAMAAA